MTRQEIDEKICWKCGRKVRVTQEGRLFSHYMPIIYSNQRSKPRLVCPASYKQASTECRLSDEAGNLDG